ncbi:uncharacterized protein [Dysidea avara]|uniref:uncharacterized protein isoform X1 n=1 Tax=Dysidea avara TaxID=196820 RepID=UPI0033175923
MADFGPYHSATSLLCDGAVVSLWSRARGLHVFINDEGNVHGDGQLHKSAEWKVHERGDGMVAFQNEQHPGKWLRIKDDDTNVGGDGGPWCDFKVHEIEGFIALESTKNHGQHLGIRPDGSLKPPTETGKGEHGQFAVIVKSKGPHHRPMMPSANLMKQGAHVHVISKSAGRGIQNKEDTPAAKANSGPWSVFNVELRGPGRIALHSVKEHKKYMRIKDGKLDHGGDGGKWCDLYVHDVENGYVVFESCQNRGTHVGILPDGSCKNPNETGVGEHGQFWVIVDEMPDPNADSACVPIKQAGPCALSEGAVVHLFSRDSGAYLHLGDDGTLTAKQGTTDKRTEWKVHHRGENVAFQNEEHKGKWLRIKDNSTDCGGDGGPWCYLHVHTHDNGFVSLESTKDPGQHVGANDGNIKPPNHTGTGRHGQWHVVLDEKADRTHQLPTTPGTSFLRNGAIIVLCSRANGRTLMACGDDRNSVKGNGGTGHWAQFKVVVKEPGRIALQFEKNHDKFLRIKGNHTDLRGQSGGPFTYFYVHNNNNGTISLESVENRSQHIGITGDGQLKPANETGTGKHGQFYPILL